ncbi:hypothetical protein [Salmonella bongori]|uniref:Uncharacterized protein n=2 Tax=Salmonella TaxID=590 RepID=A0A750KMJ0_SALER|nr:hypothetical protein [Salmonella bongori]AID27009.1 hypothetical protein N643_03125 [Salmonella bongori serovar 48:z41:-- str. RKS3044]EGS1128289.1 hypothetical protein [Salmonella bongori CFSAN000509]MBA2134429.1 hypothetical protein [Salmonella bongori serovar 66:z39:-]HAC6693904.1 hypothetical protein [Salmonella bongori serovar 44:r:-]
MAEFARVIYSLAPLCSNTIFHVRRFAYWAEKCDENEARKSTLVFSFHCAPGLRYRHNAVNDCGGYRGILVMLMVADFSIVPAVLLELPNKKHHDQRNSGGAAGR